MKSHLTADFFRALVDSISETLCVIDQKGDILFVNASWREFGQRNGSRHREFGKPINYLDICDSAARKGHDEARQTARGLRGLIRGESCHFTQEYPCHSPHQQRWFILVARPLDWHHGKYFVIEHTDITQRKQAEIEVQRQSLTDRLTGLANRRHFDEFLARSWSQQLRDSRPLAMILLDLDYFKRLNDQHGHQAGDACLSRIAAVLSTHARRASDLAARYGGEEMALVLSGIDLADAQAQAETMRREIESLGGIEGLPALTASFGVASTIPKRGSSAQDLVAAADRALYQAKREGRNRVCVAASELAA